MRRTSALLAVLAMAGILEAQNLPPGQIIDKVECGNKPEQTYALFLPARYSPDKRWPIIYAFDPGARGTLAVERFRDAAEKLGFIVAASNNARNGPWKPIVDAAWAVWADTEGRLSIDDKRIYAAGFSGGSRAASLFSWMIGRPVAGVMGFGAGLAPETGLGNVLPSAYYGIVGTGDFNYREMKRLGAELGSKNIPNWIEVTGEGHGWPSPAACEDAVAWMETIAMRGNLVPKDEAFLEALYAAGRDRAGAFEKSGDSVSSSAQCEKLVSMFKGLRDLDDVIKTIDRLKETPSYRGFKKNEALRDRKEEAAMAEFSRVFAAIEASARVDVTGMSVRISGLEVEAEEAPDPADRDLAVRLLLGLDVEAGRRGLAYHAEGSFRKASLCFEIASRASGRDDARARNNLYNLACAQAREGNVREALAWLQKAVDKGFSDRAFLLNDKDLDAVRKRPEFQEILKKLGIA